MHTKSLETLRVAIAHDVLVETGGAEVVLLTLLKIFPYAHLYIGLVNPECNIYKNLKSKIKRSFAKTPGMFPASFIKPLLYYYWENLDFTEYDLVVSSSGSFSSKSVITSPTTLHICYCHTPPKYLYGEFAEEKFGLPFLLNFKIFLFHFLRIQDFVSSQRPNLFIANSFTTKLRIEKYYRRDSEVIYPPILVHKILKVAKKGDYYIYVGRIYKQKGVDLLVEAFNALGKKLLVLGSGRELEILKKKAKPNIKFKGFVSDQEKWSLLSGAKAFVNAAIDEDFGIAPVEAMACGVPVIAYRSGGLRETVVEGKSGIFFEEFSRTSLITAVNKFEKMKFKRSVIIDQAKKFSAEVFERKIIKFLRKTLKA